MVAGLPASMFRRLFPWCIAPVTGLLLSGCGESEKPAPPSPQPVVEEMLGEPEAPVEPTAEPEPAVVPEPTVEPSVPRTRAEVLGFARHIPADAEALVTFHQAASAIERIRMMKLWGAAASEMPKRPFLAPQTEDDDFSDLQGLHHEGDMFEPGPMMSPLEMFGTEVTIALGNGGTARIAAWVEMNRRSTYQQMRGVAAALSGKMPEETDVPFSFVTLFFGAFANSTGYGDLVQDDAAMRALDNFHMPPIYIAVRAEENRIREVHEILSEPVRNLTEYNEMVAPIEVVRAGVTFNGYRLIGADLAKSLHEGHEYLVDYFGGEVFDRMIEFLKTRELVALSGIVGEYSVVFFGTSVDELQLVESPEQAITHGDTLAFTDPLLAYPFYGLIHGEKALIQALSTHALGDIALGLRDGFAANDRDGRNRDLVALLQVVSERERALRALARHEVTSVTLVDDGGPRIDAHGSSFGMLDFSSPSRFAALGDDPDVAMFLNMSIDARYSSRSTAYKEALFETTYALLMRLLEMPEETDGENEFGFAPYSLVREYTALFENDFRGDIVNIWRAIARDMRNGLGRESAIVVDLKGTVPAIPGMPKALVGKASSPRITYLAPVANRERLGTAWEKIHESATRITNRIGELQERAILLPQPIRSEIAGLSSWFLPYPIFDDEFLPSVTLDDTWFALGTSRNQAVDLIQRLDALEPRPGGGLQLKVNFRLIAGSYREQIATLIANRDAILESEKIETKEFDAAITKLEELVTGLEELESLEARCWEENGTAHTRIHLRVSP